MCVPDVLCFLPMPYKLISCISLPPATITSVPKNDYAIDAQSNGEEDICYPFSLDDLVYDEKTEKYKLRSEI